MILSSVSSLHLVHSFATLAFILSGFCGIIVLVLGLYTAGCWKDVRKQTMFSMIAVFLVIAVGPWFYAVPATHANSFAVKEWANQNYGLKLTDDQASHLAFEALDGDGSGSVKVSWNGGDEKVSLEMTSHGYRLFSVGRELALKSPN